MTGVSRLLCLVACVAAPLVLGGRWLSAAAVALVLAIGAVGLNFLTGMTGQLSLGHAALLGVGAFTAAALGGTTSTGLSTERLVGLELPVIVWLPASGVAAGLAGLLVAPAAARLRGLSLGIVTVGLVFLGGHLFATATSLTGGANGRSIPELSIGGHRLRDALTVAGIELGRDAQWFYIAAAVLALAVAFVRNVERSRFGRACSAVRDRDTAALVIGVDVNRVKLGAFALSSIYAGVCGALYASYLGRVVGATQFDLLFSIQLVVMIIVGGLGSTGGAVCGALFVTFLPVVTTELRGAFPFLSDTASGGLITGDQFAVLLYGAALVAVLVIEPRGFAGMWGRTRAALRAWPLRP
jgi:branched-chain amino acid transport system permease protein